MNASWLKRISRRLRRDRCPECGHGTRDTFCDVCGYDLVRRSQDKAFHRPVV